MILAVLIISNINAFSPVSNGDGLGITTVQARKKTHQLPDLLDQQITISVGLDINPNWVRERNAVDGSIYGIVKPDDAVPARINEDHSYLVTSNRDKKVSLFFKMDKKKVMIRHASHSEKLRARAVPLSRLVEQSHRIEKQRQQVNKYADALQTE